MFDTRELGCIENHGRERPCAWPVRNPFPELRHAFSLVLVAILLFLCGCGESSQVADDAPPELDRSLLLTDDPCAAPCWAGLVPGESSKEEVHAVLASSLWVREGSVESIPRHDFGPGGVEIIWDDRDIPHGANRVYRAYVVNDRLVLIMISVDYDNLTLGQIVDKYGSPESLSAELYAWDEIVAYTYIITLNYPARGLRFEGRYGPVPEHKVLTLEGLGQVNPEMHVTNAYYFAPDSFENVLRGVFRLDSASIERILRCSHPWEGFGEVELCCDGYIQCEPETEQ